ncbi:MAG: M28 family peptidase [Bacteroidota bacterium]
MKYLTLSILFVASLMGLRGQQSVVDPIQAYSESITADDMKAHLYFLADDLLEGRETGERGQHLASIYIRAHFMRLGLLPGNPTDQTYFQKFYLNKSKVNAATINMNGEEFEFGKGFVGSASMPSEMTADLVFAGFGLSKEGYDNLAGVDLTNKVAIILSGTPEGMEAPEGNLFGQIKSLKARGEALIAKGAKGVIASIPDSVYKIMARYSRTRSTSISAKPQAEAPFLMFQDQDIANLLTKGKKSIPELREAMVSSATLPKTKLKKKNMVLKADVEFKSKSASNVLAYLEGTDKKDELLIITAHYDHVGIGRNKQVYNGADDDGSGTTAVLELAEAFVEAAKNGEGPRRSILFMTVSGEEKGLLGSEFYTDNPLYPLERTVADLNIDMIGRVDRRYEGNENEDNYIYLIGSDKLSTDLHELSEEANDKYTQLTLDYKYNDDKDPNRFYYRSDHYNFAKNNIPIIFYFNGTHEDYHQPGDDPDKIHYQKMENITRLVFATAWEVANREERIRVDKGE